MSLTQGTLCNILRALGFSRMNASYHMMLKYFLHQCQFNLLLPPSKPSFIKIRISNKEHLWPSIKLSAFWDFCLKNTYIFISRQILWANRGCSNWITNEPIVANLYMEEFEAKALTTSPNSKAVEKVSWWHFCLSSNQHTRMNFYSTSIP